MTISHPFHIHFHIIFIYHFQVFQRWGKSWILRQMPGSPPKLVTMDPSKRCTSTSMIRTIGCMFFARVQGWHFCSSFAIWNLSSQWICWDLPLLRVFFLWFYTIHFARSQPTDRKPEDLHLQSFNQVLALPWHVSPRCVPVRRPFAHGTVCAMGEFTCCRLFAWHVHSIVYQGFQPLLPLQVSSSSIRLSPFFFALALTCRAGIMLFKGQLSQRKFTLVHVAWSLIFKIMLF